MLLALFAAILSDKSKKIEHLHNQTMFKSVLALALVLFNSLLYLLLFLFILQAFYVPSSHFPTATLRILFLVQCRTN